MKTKAWRSTRDVESKITEMFKPQANVLIPKILFPDQQLKLFKHLLGYFAPISVQMGGKKTREVGLTDFCSTEQLLVESPSWQITGHRFSFSLGIK